MHEGQGDLACLRGGAREIARRRYKNRRRRARHCTRTWDAAGRGRDGPVSPSALDPVGLGGGKRRVGSVQRGRVAARAAPGAMARPKRSAAAAAREGIAEASAAAAAAEEGEPSSPKATAEESDFEAEDDDDEEEEDMDDEASDEDGDFEDDAPPKKKAKKAAPNGKNKVGPKKAAAAATAATRAAPAKAAPKAKAKAAPKAKPAGKGKATTKAASPEATYTLVQELLESGNRPYNVQICIDMLQSKGGKKAAIEKALAKLVAEGRANLKEYGKAKVYLAAQPDNVLSEEEIVALRAEVSEAEKVATVAAADAKSAANAERALHAEPTDAELAQQLEAIRERVNSNEEKLASLRATGEKIDLEDMSKETKATAAAVAEWKKRRRMFLDVEGFLLDAAAEGGLTKQKLREDADIEDDEMHGVDCKAAEAMIKTHEAKTKAAVRGTGAPAEGRLNQRMGFLRR